MPKAAAPQREPARPARPLTRRARLEEAPKAPWHPFPLVELTVLLALVFIVLGFVSNSSHRRATLIALGLVLGTLSGLELSIREHFAGYRSHSSLLAGATALVVDLPLYFLTALPQVALLATAVVVFGVAFYLLRNAFMRRSGGLGFRA
jgi:predicted membrane channel-forming protein YqfA (hemolysin III family)